MTTAPVLMRMLQQVAARLRLQAWGRWHQRCFPAAAAVYALLLLTARLLTLLPDVYTWWTVACVPVVSLLAATLLHRSPSLTHAAHLADQNLRTKDLFLTTLLLDHAPGEYQPLVVEEAQRRAPEIRPASIVPLQPWPGVTSVLTVLLLLAAMAHWLPSLDPWGKREQEKKQAQRQQRLAEQVQQVETRKAELARKNLEQEHSPQVAAALEELRKTLTELKPQDPQTNARKLAQQQQTISNLWRQQSEQKLRDSLQRPGMQHRFGQVEAGKLDQWKKEFEQGKTDAFRQELKSIEQKLQELAAAKDPGQQQKLQREVQQQLQQASQFAQQIGSQDLANSLQQASQQTDTASSSNMTAQAANAAKQSVQLSQAQAQQVAQTMRNQQSLQQAMQTLQQAQTLNRNQSLQQPQAMQSLAQMQQQFSQQLAQQQQQQAGQAGSQQQRQGQGQGQPGSQPGQQAQASGASGQSGSKPGQPGSSAQGNSGQSARAGGQGGSTPSSSSGNASQGGTQASGTGASNSGRPGSGMASASSRGSGNGGGMGNRGIGQGGSAPENPNQAMNFKTEKSRSQLLAGQMLLKWKTEEKAPTGQAREQFEQSVADLKEGVVEAIQTEEVPAGYHDAIRQYFETSLPGPAKPRPADQAPSPSPSSPSSP